MDIVLRGPLDRSGSIPSLAIQPSAVSLRSEVYPRHSIRDLGPTAHGPPSTAQLRHPPLEKPPLRLTDRECEGPAVRIRRFAGPPQAPAEIGSCRVGVAVLQELAPGQNGIHQDQAGRRPVPHRDRGGAIELRFNGFPSALVTGQPRRLPVREAATQAARQRLRPILMTSLAFILGVLPLVLAGGAGAVSRHSIGTGVFAGMLVATLVGIFFIPLFYSVIAGMSRQPVPRSAPEQEHPR